MRFLKNVFSQLHSFVLWALMSFIVWGWIFTLVTDAPPEKKITVYCAVPRLLDTELDVALEEDMPEGIRMVRVHTFDYVMLNVDAIENGDIFILPVSQIGEYEELLAPVEGRDGVLIWDGASGAAGEYIGYTEEEYYLFLGANSVHLDDGRALAVAEQILSMKPALPA